MNREKSRLSRNGRRSEERQQRCDPVTKPTSFNAMKRNLSPLEMFRMKLDAEGPEDEVQSCADSQDEEVNSNAASTPNVGDSPVYTVHDGYGISESYEEASLNNQTQIAAPLDSTRRRETKLNSKFPFKRRCKMAASSRRARGVEDKLAVSKEKSFKNPQYLANPLSSSTSKTNNSRREGSQSPENPSLVQAESEESPKASSLPKTRRRPTVVRCLPQFEEKRRKSTDSVKESKTSAKSRPMPQLEFPGQLQRSASHNLESQEMSPCSTGGCYRFKMEDPKRRMSCKNFLKKLMSLTAPATEITSFYDTSSQDDISPSSSPDRAPSPPTNSSRPNSAQRTSSSGRNSKDKGRTCGVAKEKASLSPSERSRNGRSMGRTLCKEKNDGSRSARTEEEAIGTSAHQGFTAFVPFQGFAAFSTHGGAAQRSTPTPARCCS